MILISHRGNINGRVVNMENTPEYIDNAIRLNYDVEIDIWYIDGKIYLGHDEPQYEINYDWLNNRLNKLWIHCKNVESLCWIKNTNLHYFWHESDTVTLTSKNYIWAFPGKQPINNSISVMPEINNDDISKCIGICSDYVSKYNK
jgi:hypothetical protein